jgi:penicillin G amidase
MKLLATVVVLVAACTLSVTYLAVRGSLPLLDGEVALPGLSATVTVDRDVLGVPTVTGKTRSDVARVTGFLHGQDRFFQMDLMRRLAAGELSGLVGQYALDLDKDRRRHQLRAAARSWVANANSEELEILEAYSAGVNAGLRSLRAAPFEYILLRTRIQPWRPEDTMLVNLAMYFQLNDSDASRDQAYATLHSGLPILLRQFILNEGTEWDAPLIGDALPVPPPPGANVCNLRDNTERHFVSTQQQPLVDNKRLAGSNSWAISGNRTSTGKAIVANDMHLDLNVPNIWYRMRLVVDNKENAERALDITGVTLPGAPAIIVGSNGSIAWGFTNSRGDWSDLIDLEVDPGNPDAYLTPDGYRLFDHHIEAIDVRRAPTAPVEIRTTIWGPVVSAEGSSRMQALRWLAHEPEASNLKIMGFENAETVHEAISVAHAVGAPPQNIVIADNSGNIAWTIMGRIPIRVGFDSRLPTSWATENVGWQGWLPSEDYPVIVNPESGALWTANARVLDGAGLDAIGKGGFSLGARAQQIRDSLLSLDRATIDDMLSIQLDDRSPLHQRWRDLLLSALNEGTVAGNRQRAELRSEALQWDGRADPDTAGYRLARDFRRQVSDELLSSIVSACGSFEDAVTLQRRNQSEGPIWRLVTEQPDNLLPANYQSWQQFFLAAADRTIASCDQSSLSQCTWGEINPLVIAHPLANVVPILTPLLTVHTQPLPGGDHTPRLQQSGHGASERFAVTPGDEENGYFHMPAGQSGHPLSVFYRAGHEAWARGERQPFLPSAAKHTLTLNPGN